MLIDMKRALWTKYSRSARAVSGSADVQGPAYRAYGAFTQKHPRLKESLFDEHFLKTRIIPMLAYATQNKKNVHPILLARAWIEQFTPTCYVRMDQMQRMKPLMKEFLEMYEQEMGGMK